MTCASTVRSVMNRRPAIALLERPSATRPSTSRSRSVSSASGSSRRRRPKSRVDDGRVDDGLALRDPTQRVDEDGNVKDALLEQVADALGMLFEQPQRVAGLHVLREDQNADIGVLGANALGGDEALVGVRRGMRMSTIATSGRLSRTSRSSCSASPASATTSMPASFEQAHDPLACEHDVVGDDYPHGTSARRVVSPSSSVPPTAPTRSARCGKWPLRGLPSSLGRDQEAAALACRRERTRNGAPRRAASSIASATVT